MAAPTRRDFCTPDHCVYPYCPDTFHKPIFEINETDSIGIKESKRLWNSSNHECHPNYMDKGERYRILTTYPKEHAILTSIWEERARHEPGTVFSTHYEQIKQAELEGKEIIQILNRKKSIGSQFVDDYPNGSTAFIALGVSAIALFFFMTLSREEFLIGAVTVCLVGSASLHYTFKQIILSTSQN